MVDPTAEETLSSTLESSLCDDVQDLFKDMNSQKGILAWSLQRKVEDNPSCSVSLIPILVKKLEETLTKVSKSHEKKTYMPIIPVLHTLYYVVIQPGVTLHKNLYQNLYECLVKLLILPSPYSAVALHTLRSIKMEMTAPGSLYLKRVIAEQNMKNEYFAMREKVFVLADPAVFSAPLEATVKAYLNVSSWLRNTQTMEKTVLFHVLQTGLEMTCQGSRLAQALEVLEDHVVKEYFQDVVQAVNQCLNDGPDGRGHYLNQLKQINKSILAASNKEIINGDEGPVYSTTMPLPEIKFLMWKDEEILWDLLAEFTLNSGSQRLSRDSGIMKNLKVTDSDDTGQPPDRTPKQPERRNAWKKKQSLDQMILMTEKIEVGTGNASLRKEERSCTARVVIMGNDCTLGRLTRAYYAIREKESKHNMLTKKLDLQLYYIPVSGVEPSLSSPDDSRLSLASCLDRVDPWYSVNISSLGAAIPTLPELPSVYNKPSELSLYLLDTMCYYLRCGTQPVNLPVYSVKLAGVASSVVFSWCSRILRPCHVPSDARVQPQQMTPCNSDATSVEELFVSHLEADIPEFRHLKDQHLKEPSVRQKKSSVELFGVVLSVSYTKTSMSKRDVKGEAAMTWRVVMTSEPAASASGENYLIARFDSLNPAYNTKIQTQNISIKTMEHRTLRVCLDKDPSRTYTDIQRIEISPCLDPGCNIRSRRSIGNEQELPLNKYLDKVLSVPINTFSGVTI